MSSKSDDDLDIVIDDDECDNLQDAYDKLYQLSEDLTKNNYKLNRKVNVLVKEKFKIEKGLIKANEQINGLSEKLAVTEKERENLSSQFKTLLGKNSKLDREIDGYVIEKNNLESRIAMLESELNASTIAIKKMNAGTKALDEMLSSQKTASDRTGLGYQASSSVTHKTGGKINFVKAQVIDPSPQKVKKVQFIPTCHNCGIIGHIRPHCNNLRATSYTHTVLIPICHHCGVKGHIRPKCLNLNIIRKKVRKNLKKKSSFRNHEKIAKPKTKSVWVRKSDLKYVMLFTLRTKLTILTCGI